MVNLVPVACTLDEDVELAICCGCCGLGFARDLAGPLLVERLAGEAELHDFAVFGLPTLADAIDVLDAILPADGDALVAARPESLDAGAGLHLETLGDVQGDALQGGTLANQCGDLVAGHLLDCDFLRNLHDAGGDGDLALVVCLVAGYLEHGHVVRTVTGCDDQVVLALHLGIGQTVAMADCLLASRGQRQTGRLLGIEVHLLEVHVGASLLLHHIGSGAVVRDGATLDEGTLRAVVSDLGISCRGIGCVSLLCWHCRHGTCGQCHGRACGRNHRTEPSRLCHFHRYHPFSFGHPCLTHHTVSRGIP